MNILHLVEASIKDAELIYNWANDPEVRNNAVNNEPIIYENHLEWFNKKINSTESIIFIAYLNETPIGQIRFDKNNDDWQIDYLIDSIHRGKGFGKEIVWEGMKIMNKSFGNNLTFTAFVKADNIASIKVFRNINYLELSNSIIDESEFLNFIYSPVK